MLLFKNMEKVKKSKKSGFFLTNIILLALILIIFTGYLNRLNSESKNKSTQIINKANNKINKDGDFSSFENTNEDNIKIFQDNLNKNILKKEGKYIKIIKSCDIHFAGDCVRARACPSLECPAIADLRNDMVLKTDGEITNFEGINWYHIVFEEWVRYPDRTARDWYISSDYLKEISAYTEKFKDKKIAATSTKKIVVNLKEQKLYAYEGNIEFMETYISSGLDDLPTPIGTFNIFEKTPSRYMQGPLPGISDQEYDLPGVPWTMYFTHEGAAIHGTYWHNNFGTQWSHGCINLNPESAERLYSWAEVGTQVVIER